MAIRKNYQGLEIYTFYEHTHFTNKHILRNIRNLQLYIFYEHTHLKNTHVFKIYSFYKYTNFTNINILQIHISWTYTFHEHTHFTYTYTDFTNIVNHLNSCHKTKLLKLISIKYYFYRLLTSNIPQLLTWNKISIYCNKLHCYYFNDFHSKL